jgi:hypothetical protein
VPEWDWGAFFPGGTVQSKVVDSKLAESMQFWGQLGHHGSDFIASEFVRLHPEYGWMAPLLKDMKYEPWAHFSCGPSNR